MANDESRNDRFTGLEDAYKGYQVNDRDGEKIGKVDDLFVDESDSPEYIGVKMGLLGLNSTLIPMDACRVDESDQTITVSAEKSQVQDGPDFDDDEAISPDFERRVRSHYGLEGHDGESDRGGYGAYYSDDDDDDDDDDVAETSGRSGTSRDTDTDDDELRVQRTEEELRAGTREREAGSVNVRKRVRTDKEQVTVPKKREEVNVERVPVDEESADAEIGDDEISVPVVEEEVVAEKKPVVKEEIRVQKDVVEDEEVVEEEVRKEEIEVEDTSERRDR